MAPGPAQPADEHMSANGKQTTAFLPSRTSHVTTELVLLWSDIIAEVNVEEGADASRRS